MIRRQKVLISVVAIVVSSILGFLTIDRNEKQIKDNLVVTKSIQIVDVKTSVPFLKKIDAKIEVSGLIVPWQESIISAEVSGFKIKEVNVDVGSKVKKGQVLAELDGEAVNVEYLQSKAAFLEASAKHQQDVDTANRARGLEKTNALSSQQFSQYITAEQVSKARLEAAQAALELQKLKLKKLLVVAPDEGVISSRKATVGSLVSQNELFRLVRKEKLQWRPEVHADNIDGIKKGQLVEMRTKGNELINVEVNEISPIVNDKTKMGLVFVNLNKEIHKDKVKIGMTIDGDIVIGNKNALLINQSAIKNEDGDNFVFVVNDNKLDKIKVVLGAKSDAFIEVRKGLDLKQEVVVSDVDDLKDDMKVNVIN